MAGKSLVPSDIKVLLTLSLFLVFSSFFVVFDMSEPTICPTNVTLQQDAQYNKRRVEYYFNTNSPYLHQLQLDDVSIDAISDVPKKQTLVVVTATSASHVSDTLIWLAEFTKIKRQLKLIVFDLGLTDEQRQQISDNRAEVRPFPFKRFPSHVKENIRWIAWKPLLIQMCLLEFGHVIYMDVTVRLIDNIFDENFDVGDDDGISVPYNNGIDVSAPLHYVTNQNTFQALREHPCTFHDVTTFNAAVIIVRRTRFVERYVMRPWVGCAINRTCIAGDGVTRLCAGANTVGYCHKFDTSVLSIILHRLYSNQTARDRIDLSKKIKWVKCYSRKELILWDDAIFTDFQGYDQTYCRKLAV